MRWTPERLVGRPVGYQGQRLTRPCNIGSTCVLSGRPDDGGEEARTAGRSTRRSGAPVTRQTDRSRSRRATPASFPFCTGRTAESLPFRCTPPTTTPSQRLHDVAHDSSAGLRYVLKAVPLSSEYRRVSGGDGGSKRTGRRGVGRIRWREGFRAISIDELGLYSPARQPCLFGEMV